MFTIRDQPGIILMQKKLNTKIKNNYKQNTKFNFGLHPK